MDNQNITNNNFEQIHIDYIEKMFSKFNFYYPEKTNLYVLCKKLLYTLKINTIEDLESAIIKEIKTFIKESPKKETKILNTIEKYIEKQVTYSDDYQKNYYTLNKFTILFLKLDIEFDIELSSAILNRVPLLNKLLENVVEKELPNIKKYDVNELYNKNLAPLIHVYCSNNNISIIDEDLDSLYDEVVKSKLEDSNAVFLKEIGKYPLLSSDIQKEQIAKYQKDNDKEAKEKLINHNLRLVVSIAKKYQNRGLDFLDLVQEGTLGLIKAIDRFNLEKETELSTYATWWISQSISRALIFQGRNIRLPVHIAEKKNKIKKFIADFEKENNREPTLEEVAQEFDMSVKKLNEFFIDTEDTTSLNTKIGDKDDTELEYFVEDIYQKPEEEAISNNYREYMIKALKEALTEKELEIILMRFGFYNDDPQTLEECGKKYNVTRERIRQIEAKALRKLRHPKNIVKFTEATNTKEIIKSNSLGSKSQPPKTNGLSQDTTIEKLADIHIAQLLNYFPTYNYVELKTVLEKLNPQDIKILKDKAEDLIRGTTSLSSLSENRFKTSILPKMEAMLQNQNSTSTPPILLTEDDLKQLNLYFSEYTYNQIKNIVSELNQSDIYRLKKLFDDNIKNEHSTLTADDYFKIEDAVFSKITTALEKTDSTHATTKTLCLFPKSFYEKFEGYSINQIHNAISYLGKTDYRILNVVYLDNENTEIAETAKYRLESFTIPTILETLKQNNLNTGNKKTLSKTNFKNIYSILNKYSRYQVNQALLYLDINDFNLLKKYIFTDYTFPTLETITKETQKSISSIVHQMSQFLKDKKQSGKDTKPKPSENYNCCKNIYDFFSEYSSEEINNIIKTLDLFEYNILLKRYGNDFSNPKLGFLSKEDTILLYTKIIPKMSKLLSETYSKIQEGKQRRNFSLVNLYKYFNNFSKEAIDEAIKQLDKKEYEILTKWFKDDFESPTFSNLTEEEIEKLYGSIILKVMHLLKDNNPDNSINKKIKNHFYNIYIYFSEYSKEDVNCALRYLKDEEYRIILKKLDNSFTNHTVNTLTKSESHSLFGKILVKLEKRLASTKCDFVDTNLSDNTLLNNTLYTYFNIYSPNEINEAITLFPAKDQALLRKILYNSINIGITPEEINYLMNRLLPEFKKILDRNYVKVLESNNQNNFYLLFPDNSKEEIDQAINQLEEKYKKLLYQRYSGSLEKPIITHISENERKRINSKIIPKIKENLKKEKNNMAKKRKPRNVATIYTYYSDFTKDEIDVAIKELKPEYYDILLKKYGGNLENPQPGELTKKEYTRFYQTVLPNIKKNLDKQNKQDKKDDTTNNNTNSDHENQNNIVANNQNITESNNEAEIVPAQNKIQDKKDNTTNTDIKPENKKENQNDIETSNQNITKSNNETEITPIQNKVQDKNNYIISVNELKNGVLEEMISQLPIESAFILNLKFGYIRDKYFSNKEIAEFLGISEEEVRTTIKTTLIAYKELLVAKMDESIDIITNDSYQYVKKANE